MSITVPVRPHAIISGNHNKRVGVGVYPRERVYAYVVPN
jgi:hypothetical protein